RHTRYSRDWSTDVGSSDLENSGYPIVDFDGDGRFRVTKPEGTGGLVNVATVSEQILYEVGDLARYILPDVICDFTQVVVAPHGPDRKSVVWGKRVGGARRG